MACTDVVRFHVSELTSIKRQLPAPCTLTDHHVTKVYWGVELELRAFLTLVLDEGEWSASRPGRFTRRERAPGTHWLGGWVGSRAGLDTGEEKNSQRLSLILTPINISWVSGWFPDPFL